jgi:hypothetical protein
MKTKNYQRAIHQYIEELLRHRASISIVLLLMLVSVSSFDGRVRGLLQEVYAQGWGWVGTYMHHEHPTHANTTSTFSRMPTIVGPRS